MAEGDSATALEVLDKDYQETVAELTGPKAAVFEGFLGEYEKLYKALLKSHDNEKRLTKKIRDLNAEISANAANVQTAMKLAQEDQQHILTLKRNIETEQKQVEQSIQKEAANKETIAKFKADIKEYVEKIEQGATMTEEQQALLSHLAAQKEQIEKDRDLLKQNSEMLQNITATELERLHDWDSQLGESEENIVAIKHKLADKRTEVENEKRRKEDLEQQMKDLRISNELHQEEVNSSRRNVVQAESDLRRVDEEIVEAEKEEHRLETKVRLMMDEKHKLELKLEQELTKNNKYTQENEQRELARRAKADEIATHKVEQEKCSKLHEALKAKERSFLDECHELEDKRNVMKAEGKVLQEQLDGMRREGDVDRKKIEDLLRERDILNKNVIKADERTKKQIDLVKRQETQAMNLGKDIARWKLDAQEFKKRIYELEKTREKYGIELSQANAKYFAALEELKSRDARLTELKKQIADVQAKRNQQKNLYDAVCMDRNLHSKNLVESTEQIAEMRRKFKIMFHTTTALKEEIREKDSKLVRGHFRHKKVLQTNDKLKDSKEKAQRRMKNLMNIVETQRKEIKELESTIHGAEHERQAQQKELEGVIGERDILGAQLIRRNEELAWLYEKIKIQQSTLQKGEIQYKERVTEVNVLRADIRETKAQVAEARNQVTNVTNLQREIHHLNKTLLREETKAKALQEELENPMNVHRWRELEGSDHQTFEMIQRVKKLQKDLIGKTEEVVDKEAQIQEKEKLYVQLKHIIARQPGPEVAEQLAWYSQNLKDKTAHMKQMAGELAMYHSQVKDLRDEIDRYNKDFANVKQTYFNSMRQSMSQQMYAEDAQ
jgi:chromosome segregation ATPase